MKIQNVKGGYDFFIRQQIGYRCLLDAELERLKFVNKFRNICLKVEEEINKNLN